MVLGVRPMLSYLTSVNRLSSHISPTCNWRAVSRSERQSTTWSGPEVQQQILRTNICNIFYRNANPNHWVGQDTVIFVKHQAVGERASKRQSRGLAMSDECMDKKNESRVQREVESGGGTLVEGSKAEEELAHKQGCSREESNMTLLCRVQKRG